MGTGGGKVGAAPRAALEEYRVRSSDYRVREGIGGLEYSWLGERGETGAKVQRYKSACGRCKRREGRCMASPRPPATECKAEPCPYPRALLARGN